MDSKDASFERWIRKKELLQRGIEVFRRLDKERAESEAKWRGVAKALQAIKAYYLQITPPSEEAQALAELKDSGDQDLTEGRTTRRASLSGSATGVKKVGPQMLFEHFRKWTIDHHTFVMVKLSSQEEVQFSPGARELFMKDDDAVTCLPTLKYSIPKKPHKKDEKVRPLTNDQKLMNTIFMRTLRFEWDDARKRLFDELDAEVPQELAGEDSVEEGAKRSEAERKNDDEGRGGGARGAQERDKPKNRMAQLYRQGIPTMLQWIEEDQDSAIEKKRENNKEKEEEARKAHDAFVRRKDSQRIRMPPPSQTKLIRVPSPPRLVFSRGKGPVRPKTASSVTTTVGMMLGSGLKYVHALSRGRQGMDGDLEKCRKQLLECGFVNKDNFDESGDFDTEKSRNVAVRRRKEQEEARKEATTKAFDEWSQLKVMFEQACKFLDAVDKPSAVKDADKAREHFMSVGRALKAVDMNLYKKWLEWAKDYKPATTTALAALWDTFEPKACDLHGSTSTAVKDIFLKLLRPGKNYKQAFEAHCERLWQRRLAEDPYAGEELKEELKENLTLNKNEMKKFLVSLGMVMQDDEIRRLIDTFDRNGDGVVSMQEFLQFVGDERGDKGGDRQASLQQKCVWHTTCTKCGMQNAYTVSIVRGVTGRRDARRDTSSDVDDDPYASPREKESKHGPEDELDVTYTKLKTGESRRRADTHDHVRRTEVLRRFGVDAHGKGEGGAVSSPKRDEYDDDFEAHEQDGEDGEAAGSHQPSAGDRCQACESAVDKRCKALAMLSKLSQENRENQALEKALSKGVPPPPPKLTVAKLGHPDVGSDPGALTTELLLLWKPQPGSLVAFVVLEQQQQVVLSTTAVTVHGTTMGPIHAWDGAAPATRQQSKNIAVEYREIARDPPDSDCDPCYQIWVRGLQPNTPYSFRIRGYNGFGAGGWACATFTTRPIPPAAPRALRCTSTSVKLCWTSSDSYQRRLQQLRKVFDAADRDKSGAISRAELLDVLKAKEPLLLEFLKKAQVGPGVSVFDVIEADDNDTLSWEEFARFFEDAEALEDNDNKSQGSAFSIAKSEQCVSANTKTRYVVERCESHEEDRYKEVYKCSSQEATIVDLRPGTTYRFRVHVVNCDGVQSAYSEPAVVNTMLETPLPPRLDVPQVKTATGASVGGHAGYTPNMLRIVWDQRTRSGPGMLPSDKKKGQLDKVLADWTKTMMPSAEGVSLRAVFKKYDRNGDGTIDAAELEDLLQDLGVPPTEEKIREALSAFDDNDDNKISYDEFERWWHRDEILYTLKRTDGIAGSAYVAGEQSSGQLRTVCYRGTATSCEVFGLVPNTLYEFRLRSNNARSRSVLSLPLQTMTPPMPPQAPIIARTEVKSAVLRWYPGAHGAHKYVLQQKLLESLSNVALDTTTKSATRAVKADDDWTVIYEGQNTMFHATGLAINSVYRFRVQSVNQMDGRSEWSAATQVSTVQQASRVCLRPTNASECFTVDCTGDVVAGDTILFTERLYRGEDGKLIETRNQGGAGFKALNSPGMGTPRLRMSAFSVESLASGRSAALGEFIGERTVAAHVWAISDLTGKGLASKLGNTSAALKNSNNDTVVPEDTGIASGFGAIGAVGGLMQPLGKLKRVLRMEVVWSTVQRKEMDSYLLSKGAIIQRSERKVFQFETFRTPWEHEKRRLSSEAEQRVLAGFS